MYLKNRFPKKRSGSPKIVLMGAPDDSFYEPFKDTNKLIFSGPEFPPWEIPELIFFYYNPLMIKSAEEMSFNFAAPLISILHSPPKERWSLGRIKDLTQFGHIALATTKELGEFFGVDVLPENKEDFLQKIRYIEYYPIKAS